jgi:Fe2+-dicitrate sensor, membrane component
MSSDLIIELIQMNILDEQLIDKFLNGNCSELEVEEILRWINESDENKNELLKLKIIKAKGIYNNHSRHDHIDRSLKELQRMNDYKERIRQEVTRKVKLRFVRYAASILLVIGISLGAFLGVHDYLNPEMIVVAVEANAPARKVILDDKTQVLVSGNSRIEYPNKFSRGERKVSVTGKVFFNVAKDAKRPFLVETDDYIVKVLGTSFEINSFKNKTLSDVILESGSVEVLRKDSQPICRLEPGQQFEYDKTKGLFTVNQIDTKAYTGWTSGTLEFDGLSFVEIVKILERHYNVRVVLDERVNKEQKFVGSLSFEKNIQEMMKTIEHVTSVKYHVEIDTIVYIYSER